MSSFDLKYFYYHVLYCSDELEESNKNNKGEHFGPTKCAMPTENKIHFNIYWAVVGKKLPIFNRANSYGAFHLQILLLLLVFPFQWRSTEKNHFNSYYETINCNTFKNQNDILKNGSERARKSRSENNISNIVPENISVEHIVLPLVLLLK